MSYKPIDSKRDQFRKYIESTGVVEMLSKALIQLLESPEKPENPIDFLRANIGATLQEKGQIDFLNKKVESYKQQVEELKKQLEEFKAIKHVEVITSHTDEKDVKIEESANKTEKLIPKTEEVNVQPMVENKEQVPDETGKQIEEVNASEIALPIETKDDLADVPKDIIQTKPDDVVTEHAATSSPTDK